MPCIEKPLRALLVCIPGEGVYPRCFDCVIQTNPTVRGHKSEVNQALYDGEGKESATGSRKRIGEVSRSQIHSLR